VLRGEDLLSSTPRQLALFDGLKTIGVATQTPAYGHLPYVMGEGNKKLSKRDPESSLSMYRSRGYLPEALLNYLALLGWSMGNDVEFFSPKELTQAFTLERVNPNPARFDLKKCTSINGDWIRRITEFDLCERLIPFMELAGVVSTPITAVEQDRLKLVIPLIQERLDTLDAAPELIRFLFSPASAVYVDPDLWTNESAQVLEIAWQVLDQVAEWNAQEIQAALRVSLIEGLSLKPKLAFGPVRTAICGRKISPPLFESMEILGREESLSRIESGMSKSLARPLSE
jgi:glutamyl-tRNA synthetase